MLVIFVSFILQSRIGHLRFGAGEKTVNKCYISDKNEHFIWNKVKCLLLHKRTWIFVFAFGERISRWLMSWKILANEQKKWQITKLTTRRSTLKYNNNNRTVILTHQLHINFPRLIRLNASIITFCERGLPWLCLFLSFFFSKTIYGNHNHSVSSFLFSLCVCVLKTLLLELLTVSGWWLHCFIQSTWIVYYTMCCNLPRIILFSRFWAMLMVGIEVFRINFPAKNNSKSQKNASRRQFFILDF